MENNNYECKRCSYQCYQLNDMKKHLNKKIKCLRNVESYNYKDDELIKLSLIRKNNDRMMKENNFYCTGCQKNFCTKSNLIRHVKSFCKNKDNINQNNNQNIKNNDFIESIKKEIQLNNLNKNTNIDSNFDANIDSNIDSNTTTEKNSNEKNIYNITHNNNVTTNNYTNNISLNINLINSFDENWTTTHIDDKTKCLLLLNNSKFTATLENILENNINLNVLLDNTSENGLVYQKDNFINMNVKDIVKTTMDKLYNKLCDFKNDILISEKNLNIDEKLLEDHIQIAHSKYNNYIEDKDVQDSVDGFIKDIYNKKKDDTLVNYNTIKNGY